ncbi:hypothetical protein [Demequina sp.]|uniref:hypothetical protein n=1 Tax=Demequina sp. TaxID=2050685 RepID=UPI003D0DBE92
MTKTRFFRGVIVATLCVALTAISPAAQSSVSVGEPVDTKCTTWTNWTGTVPTGTWLISATPAKGKVRHCARKYKVLDKDTKADYYFVTVKSEYSVTSAAKTQLYPSGSKTTPQRATISITSNKTAVGNDYEATPTVKLEKNCGNLSLSVGWIVSIGTTLEGKCKQQLTRTSYTKTGASWSVDDVAKWEVVQAVYAQKVAQGAVPKFTVKMTRPVEVYTTAKKTVGITGSRYGNATITLKKFTAVKRAASSYTTTFVF